MASWSVSTRTPTGVHDTLTSKKDQDEGEAKAIIRKALEDRDNGFAFGSENLAVEKYMDRWLESIRDKVRPATYKPYEAIVRLHVKPTLGSTKLDKQEEADEASIAVKPPIMLRLDLVLSPRRTVLAVVGVGISKMVIDSQDGQGSQEEALTGTPYERDRRRAIQLNIPTSGYADLAFVCGFRSPLSGHLLVRERGLYLEQGVAEN
jgi:hypothetical protein